jgi:hypothetical protein
MVKFPSAQRGQTVNLSAEPRAALNPPSPPIPLKKAIIKKAGEYQLMNKELFSLLEARGYVYQCTNLEK